MTRRTIQPGTRAAVLSTRGTGKVTSHVTVIHKSTLVPEHYFVEKPDGSHVHIHERLLKPRS